MGDSLENADVDAIASASITMMDDEAQGNVETMAQMIESVTRWTTYPNVGCSRGLRTN